MKSWLKILLVVLAGILIVWQFFKPDENTSNVQVNHIKTKFPMPADVESILEIACYDCHSNNTRYPWYSKIQPVAWWLNNHIVDGKRHLNYSELGGRKVNLQNHKMEETIEMVKEGMMPLSSYTWVHKDAVLSEVQKKMILDWSQGVMDSLRNNYPADSLLMPKRPNPGEAPGQAPR